MPILLPPLDEQRRIAEALDIWEEAISTAERLMLLKQRQVKGLSRLLLGIEGNRGEHWPTARMASITTPIRRTQSGAKVPVMSISAGRGFLHQSARFNREIAGSSLPDYTLLRKGEFAYNKGNSLTAPQGCIYKLDVDAALLPFVYFCFALVGDMNTSFYAYLFENGALNRQLTRVINSGVRNDGLLNIYEKDFYACVIPVPPREDQDRIAQAISAMRHEWALAHAGLTLLRRQKRGLMQKLLTGKWRVPALGDPFVPGSSAAARLAEAAE